MDAKGINDLATFSLAPKDRSRKQEEIMDTKATVGVRYINSQISKVRSLEAGWRLAA